jgi:hypothetical protein
MSDQLSETTNQTAFNRMRGSTYATHMQEAMRYGELRSWEYPVAMTIMRAISQGLTEEMWRQEQQRSLQALTERTPDANTPHVDLPNRYEQLVACFKELVLWPW